MERVSNENRLPSPNFERRVWERALAVPLRYRNVRTHSNGVSGAVLTESERGAERGAEARERSRASLGHMGVCDRRSDVVRIRSGCVWISLDILGLALC